MKLSEMITDINDELNISGIDSKIVGWLKLAQVNLETNYEFASLNSYNTVNTAIGSPDVTLQSDFVWLKNISIPVLRRDLVPRDENLIKNGNPDYRTRQGPVWNYYPSNQGNLGLFYVPDSIVNLAYNYQKRTTHFNPSSFTGNELSGLPEEWDELILQMAKTRAYKFEGNREDAITSRQEERLVKRKLNANLYKRIDKTLVFGNEQTIKQNRLPRVVLPGNYPRT